jgi:hypothetical protein
LLNTIGNQYEGLAEAEETSVAAAEKEKDHAVTTEAAGKNQAHKEEESTGDGRG